MTQQKKLSRREREKLRQRQYILDAALKLFAQRGYNNVSMCEIAEKSEFAVGTLYKFFHNKEDIYKSIMNENAGRFHHALAEALHEGLDETETLRNYVRTKMDLLIEHAAAVRLYHAETSISSFDPKAALDDDIRKQYDQLQQELAEVFARGIQKGVFNKIAEPYYLAIAMNSIIKDILLLWLEDPEKNAIPEKPDVILNILFKGLLCEPPKN